MKKFFLLFVLVIFSLPAISANWLQYEDKGWLDTSSLERHGDTITAWFKNLNPGTWDKEGNKKVWYIMNQYKANCKKKTLTLLYYASYDLKGNVITSHNFKGYEQTEEPIIPETRGEWKFMFMCGNN